jgi:hypothetical protein
MKKILIMLTVFATLYLASCASVQTYEGEALPREQVAVIKSTHWGNLVVTAVVREVDGKDMGVSPGNITVLPGEHVVKIRVSHSMGYLGTISAHGTVLLNAEAGHTYRVYGEIYGFGDGLWVWIEDEESDQIVASRKYHN